IRDVAGDVEGFGMVAVEAAAHGLPTVAYCVGGVGDAVVDGATGTLVAPGDQHSFARAILEWWPRASIPSVRTSCAQAARIFAWNAFGLKLRKLLQMSQDD